MITVVQVEYADEVVRDKLNGSEFVFVGEKIENFSKTPLSI